MVYGAVTLPWNHNKKWKASCGEWANNWVQTNCKQNGIKTIHPDYIRSGVMTSFSKGCVLAIYIKQLLYKKYSFWVDTSLKQSFFEFLQAVFLCGWPLKQNVVVFFFKTSFSFLPPCNFLQQDNTQCFTMHQFHTTQYVTEIWWIFGSINSCSNS